MPASNEVPKVPKTIRKILQQRTGAAFPRNTRRSKRHQHHFFIDKTNVPAERWKDATYGCVVVNYRTEKGDPYRTHITLGGNLIVYPGDCGTPTVDLLTFKLLLSSVISTLLTPNSLPSTSIVFTSTHLWTNSST